MKKSSSSEKAMVVRKPSPIKKSLLLINNPQFFEPFRLINYDINNLSITDDIKQSAEFILEEVSSENNYNYALAQCIVNKIIYQPMREPIFVNGFGRIVKMVSENRIVYILSDFTHSFDQTCLPDKNAVHVFDFLKFVFKTSTKFIDFFSEMRLNELYQNTMFLNDVVSTFYKCTTNEGRNKFYRNKDICPYNLRVHYADVRLKTFFINTINLDKIDKTLIPRLNKYLNIISSRESYFHWAVTYYQKNKWVLKELSKLGTLGPILLQLVLERNFLLIQTQIDISFIRQLIFSLETGSEYSLDKSKPYGGSFGYKFSMNLAGVYSFIFDIYFLSRLFKTFDTRNNIYDPTIAKFSIMYAGSAHTQIYEDILEMMGFRMTEEDIGEIASCTQLKNIRLPLFQ